MFLRKTRVRRKSKKSRYRLQEDYLTKRLIKWLKTLRRIKRRIKRKEETVDARNQADSLVFSTEKSLKEHGDKISAEEKKAIESAILDLKNSLKGTDVEDVKKKTQSLIQVSMKLGEAVYKNQQKSQNKKDDGDESKDSKAKGENKENVVDADFEDVKEDKEKSA